MKRLLKRFATSSLLLLIIAGAQAQQPVEYRFEDVRRTVTLTHDARAQKATKGQQAASGDQVETGWFAYALIGSDRHHARFEVFSATTVKLASETPGVILTLERGKIRAAFDKITGSEPRSVQTPGALLAVRGTQFDVEVDREGNTTLDVFEGLVEVRSSLQREPLMVKPGESSMFGPQRPPTVQPMPEQRRRNGPDGNRDRNDRNRDDKHRGEQGKRQDGNRNDRPPQEPGQHDSGYQPGNDPGRDPGRGSGQGANRGPSNAPPPPPPPPPPHKPPV
jgi:hypothetical protein